MTTSRWLPTTVISVMARCWPLRSTNTSPDLTVLFTQFRTGDIDYIGLQGISADHYGEAKKLTDRTVVNAPLSFIECFYFNLGLPQFQDKAVRHALYAAYDKDSIIQQLYYGLPTPSESYLPKQSWAYNPNLPKHEYNPDKAKQMLDAAGWKPGADGIRDKNGVQLALSTRPRQATTCASRCSSFCNRTSRTSALR